MVSNIGLEHTYDLRSVQLQIPKRTEEPRIIENRDSSQKRGYILVVAKFLPLEEPH